MPRLRQTERVDAVAQQELGRGGGDDGDEHDGQDHLVVLRNLKGQQERSQGTMHAAGQDARHTGQRVSGGL